MSSIQRTLLALLGLIAAAGVGTLVLGTGDPGVEDGTSGLELEQSAARDPRPTAEGVATSLVSSDGRHAVLEGSGTIVDVRTMNNRGRLVPRAVIRLTNSAGEEWTGGDAARFEDVTPGEWTLEITAGSMLTHTQVIEVVEGEYHRYAIKLLRFLPITGTVRNQFGESPGSTIIWFLRSGESHPMERNGARKLLEGQVTAAGDFQIDLPKAGEYRISVGPVGKPMGTVSKPRELHAGGSQEVDIIVSGGTRLEIQLEDAPAAMAAGKAFFRVAILGHARQAGSKGAKSRFQTADAGSRQTGTRRGKRSGKSGEKDADGEGSGRRRERAAGQGEGPSPRGGKQRAADRDALPPGSTTDLEQGGLEQGGLEQGGKAPGGRQEDAWIDRLTRDVPTDGRLFFDGLPAEEELKLAFLRRNDRHVSINPIILPEGRHVLVRIRVPDRIPKEQAGEVQDLHVMLETLPLPADAPRPGFYWK